MEKVKQTPSLWSPEGHQIKPFFPQQVCSEDILKCKTQRNGNYIAPFTKLPAVRKASNRSGIRRSKTPPSQEATYSFRAFI